MNKKPLDLCDVKTYEDWRDFVQLIDSLIPFGVKFFEIYKKLSASGAICNGYYLNYTIEDLTFESLILSAFANFKLGFFEKKATIIKWVSLSMNIERLFKVFWMRI